MKSCEKNNCSKKVEMNEQSFFRQTKIFDNLALWLELTLSFDSALVFKMLKTLDGKTSHWLSHLCWTKLPKTSYHGKKFKNKYAPVHKKLSLEEQALMSRASPHSHDSCKPCMSNFETITPTYDKGRVGGRFKG
jgi:hypothetical protein